MSRFREASFSGGSNASLTVGTGFEPSRPVGAGKGPIRSAMQGQGFSLKDRMAARRADKQMMGAPQGQPMQPRTSRLDASPTPGLDAQPRTPITYGTRQGQMAEQKAAAERSALSEAFGQRAQKRAENLAGRQELFKQMQTVGGANISESMQAKADQLGVNKSRFREVAGALPAAPASIARAGMPSMGSKYALAQGTTPAATPAATPMQGRALAEQNIATKGIQGAAADYFQRNNPTAAKPKPVDAELEANYKIGQSQGMASQQTASTTKSRFRR